MTELTMAMMMTLILVKSKMLQSMKRIISNVMLIAAAATAFFSCQKQESLAPEKAQDVVLTFSSEKPSFTDETKTEWTGTTVQWSAGDKISIAYTVDGGWMGAINSQTGVVMGTKLYKSKALESAGEKAKFDVSTSFNIDATGTHVFYGVYPAPSSTDFPNAPVANLEIPSAQTPKEDSFDGAADIMTGVSVGEFTARPAANEVISMVWTRLVAHANITLTALKDVTAGEKVLSITLTAQDGANLVGKQKVNILTNEVENNNTDSNVLKINGANLSVDSGNIEFWACVLPETITALTVVVDTDKATYTREITGISKIFKQNARNTLKIKMNEAMRVAKEVVTSDYSGTYVIVAKRNSDSKYYYMTNDLGTASTKRFTAVEAGNARPEDVTPLSDAYHWEVAKSDDLYTAKSVETNTYISWTSGNSACLKDQGVQFTIAPNEDGTYKFQYVASDATRYLSLNGTEGNNYFAWYKDGQSKDLYLIPVAPDTTPKIVVAETEKTIGSEGGDLEFEYTVANSDSELEATVTEGADFLESVEVENDIIAVTVKENETASKRVAIITLTCGDATPVVLTITQDGAEVDAVKMTVAEFIDAEDNTLCELTGTITGIVAAYDNDFNNISFNLSDDTGVVQIYRMSCAEMTSDPSTLTVGDEITVQGTKTTYNGTVQMAAGGKYISHTDKEAPSVSIIKKTVAEFLTLTGSETDKYELTGVITEIYQPYSSQYGNISFYINDGTGTVLIFRMTCDSELANAITVGDEITVQGKPTVYNGTIQMAQGGICINHKDSAEAPTITCTENVVTIEAETGAEIYYTINGDEPTEASTKYNAPFSIIETTTVKALAIVSGKPQSAVTTKVCTFVKPGQNLGAAYTAEFYGKSITYGAPLTIGDVDWTITATGSTTIASGKSDLGKQFGKKDSPCTELVFTGEGYNGGIQSIKINTSCASNVGPKIASVSVGGVEMVAPSSVALVKGSNSEFEFTSSEALTGDIVIKWESSVKAGIYVKSILINN